VMVADLVGDFRDEIVVVGPNSDGNLTVSIYSPTPLIRVRDVSRTDWHGYRMWLAHNLLGGYGAYFEPTGLPVAAPRLGTASSRK